MIEIRDCIERLSSQDEAERIYAAEDLGYANRPEGVAPLLTRVTGEPSRAVREAIFAALLQIEDDAAIHGAIGLLDSEDSFLRNQAVDLLKARGSRAIPFLEKAFREGQVDRRKFVIDALDGIRDESATDLYHRALDDPDLNVVITAIESIGRNRKSAFRRQIEERANRIAHPMLLSACLEALVTIGTGESVDTVRRSFGPAAAIPAYLLPCYIKLIGSHGSESDVTELAEMMMNRDGLQAPLVSALSALHSRYPALVLPAGIAPRLRVIVEINEAPLVSYQALLLLGHLHKQDGVMEFIESCLDDPEKAVRIAAVQAMRRAGGERVHAVMRDYLARQTDEEILQAWEHTSGA